MSYLHILSLTLAVLLLARLEQAAAQSSLPVPPLSGQALRTQQLQRQAQLVYPTNPLNEPALVVCSIGLTDTTRMIGVANLLTYLALRHPVARQEVSYAQGLFDPTATSMYYDKILVGKEYFHDWDTQLRGPLWYGVDVKAGFDRGVGTYVNLDDYTALAGLRDVGVTVPLAQGLLLDERRAAVHQAQALQGQAEAERRGYINKLLQAARGYWDRMLSSRPSMPTPRPRCVGSPQELSNEGHRPHLLNALAAWPKYT